MAWPEPSSRVCSAATDRRTPGSHHGFLARGNKPYLTVAGAIGAVTTLGRGFLAHPENAALRQQLRAGALDRRGYHRQLLHLCFGLTLAEFTATRGPEPDRRPSAATLDPSWPMAANRLAVDREAIADLLEARLTEADLREALRALGVTPLQHPVTAARDGLEPRGDQGEDDLGTVYEALLDLEPRVDPDTGTFELERIVGSERKRSGSYYTPASLVDCLLGTTLDPLLDAASESPCPETAILALKVCDPACGSGRFLVASAHRLASRLAAVRAGLPTARGTPMTIGQGAYLEALRDVILNCIHGVDLDDLAVWLCRANLWLEFTGGILPALENGDSGQLRTFLFARIKVGDSLIGATAASSAGRFPGADFSDPAQKRLALDAWCAAQVRGPQPRTAGNAALEDGEVRQLAREFRFFHWHLEFPDIFSTDRPAGPGFDVVIGNPPWERVKFQEKEWLSSVYPELLAFENAFSRKQDLESRLAADPVLRRAYLDRSRLAGGRLRFIHRSGRFPLCGRGDVNSHAVFAETFKDLIAPTGRAGLIVPTGLVSGETTQRFFHALMRDGTLASLYDFDNRDRLFAGVAADQRFCLMTLLGPAAGSRAGKSTFVFGATRTSQVFEASRRVVLDSPLLALVNPNTRTLPAFHDVQELQLVTRIHQEVPVLVNEAADPAANPSLGESDPWHLQIKTMFHMTNDSALFSTGSDLDARGFRPENALYVNEGRDGCSRYLPLVEGKMVQIFNHRFATYGPHARTLALSDVALADPTRRVLPRFWVHEETVAERTRDWDAMKRGWLLGFRDIGHSGLERAFVAAIIPAHAASNKLPILISGQDPRLQACLLANLCSFALDFVARAKIGLRTLNFYIVKQLPVLPPATYGRPTPWQPELLLCDWIGARVLELTYTAHDLEAWARDLGCARPPFAWDAGRRSRIRAELDAAFLHLYGLSADEARAVLATFPIALRNDPRLPLTVLEAYGAMAQAMASGPRDPA